jgi:cytosine deaminase
MSRPGEIDQVFAMCTQNAAQLLRLKNYGMSPGCIGDLVLLDAETPAEAITAQPDRLYVIKRGTIVAETVRERRIHWPEPSGSHLSAAI